MGRIAKEKHWAEKLVEDSAVIPRIIADYKRGAISVEVVKAKLNEYVNAIVQSKKEYIKAIK